MKHIAVLGEYREDADHPFGNVEKELKSIFHALGEVEILQDNKKEEWNLLKYDLLVIYNDVWEEPVEANRIAALLEYAASGKTIMAIHCGIFYFQANSEFLSLIGGRFYHHPPRCEMTYLTGMESSFTLYEEPYLFHFTENVAKDVFLVCRYGENFLPAGWSVPYGKGKFIYFAPGHDSDSFSNKEYIKLIRTYAKRALDES